MSTDSSPSRPSQTNCQGPAEPPETSESDVAPSAIDGGHQRVSRDGERQLRDEALVVDVEDDPGRPVPLTAPNVSPEDGDVLARPWYRVVNQHTKWYDDYRSSHIEFESPNGETVRAPLQNSYQPEYGDKYYARLMDLKRGVERRWSGFSIVMLTFSASTLNRSGQPRCPADHMRDIADGWGTARKHLYNVLDGRNWVYGKVWEATTEDGDGPAGYGHMHVAIFVEDGDLSAGEFRPVMESYVDNCKPAGWDAHKPDGDAVSVTHDLEEANAATYISEYIGAYGEDLDERPIHERAFLSVAWATRTRRVEFSNDAQDIIKAEEERGEPEVRLDVGGDVEADSDGVSDESDSLSGEGGAGEDVDIDPESESVDVEGGDGNGWTFKQLCEVDRGEPNYYQPNDGGVDMTELDGANADRDLPRDLGPPPT